MEIIKKKKKRIWQCVIEWREKEEIELWCAILEWIINLHSLGFMSEFYEILSRRKEMERKVSSIQFYANYYRPQHIARVINTHFSQFYTTHPQKNERKKSRSRASQLRNITRSAEFILNFFSQSLHVSNKTRSMTRRHLSNSILSRFARK